MKLQELSNDLFLEELQRSIQREYEDSLPAAVEAHRAYEKCRKCTTHAAAEKCGICEDNRTLCQEHWFAHRADNHADSPEFEERRDRLARPLLRAGFIAAFQLPDRALTPTGHQKTRSRSAWYQMARLMGLKAPAVVTVDPMLDLKPSKAKALEERFTRFLKEANLRVYNGTPGKNMTLMLAERTDLRVFPEEISDPPQDSLSTVTMDPKYRDQVGKVLKRMKVFTTSEGAWCAATPSHFPELQISPTLALNVQVWDTNAKGDGGGMIAQTALEDLIMAAGCNPKGDVIGVQVRTLGSDYAVKADLIGRPDHHMPQGANLVADSESINQQVLCRDFTPGKLTPLRHKPNQRYRFVDSVFQGQVVARFLDIQEVLEFSDAVANRLQRDIRTQVQRDHDEDLQEDIAPADRRRTIRRRERHVSTSTKEQMLLDYRAANHSPFTSPELMKRIAGGPASHWRAKVESADPLPVFAFSGELVRYWYWGYAGVPEPPEGYLGLVWHPTKPDELVASVLNDKDVEKFFRALDTPDTDDEFALAFCRDENHSPEALVLRSPLSVDGGTLLKLQPQDADRLREIGYHFHPRVGNHKWPNLHRDIDGKPVYPPALAAKPFEEAPTWTNRDGELLASLKGHIRYRPLMGSICNGVVNLDWAGLYDPASHLFNMSTEVVDATLAAEKDPTVIEDSLYRDLLMAVYQEMTLDPCVQGRVNGKLEELHLQIREQLERAEPASILERAARRYIQDHKDHLIIFGKCDPRHPEIKKAMHRITDKLYHELLRWLLLANGPHWLDQDFDEDLIKLATTAFSIRNTGWHESSLRKEDLREQGMPWPQREAENAAITHGMQVQEARIIHRAYREATRLPGYTPGHFMALWTRMLLTTRSRYKSRTRPISTYPMECLPDEERLPFFRGRPSTPTVVLRAPRAKLDPDPDTVYRIVRKPGTGKRPTYAMVNPQGQTVAKLLKEAAYHTGLMVRVIRPLPIFPENGSWRQEPNLLALEAILPPPAPKS